MIKLNNLKFIDLFAGIGGFHQALGYFGAECVFASEWDKNAAKTYLENYKIQPYGDITQIPEQDIPQHDILCAGFPCQAFSISGKQQGFNDTRGTLFFEIARIVAYHKPKILFLENVKNFVKHDNGNTLKIVLNTLDKLGYDVFYQVLNASNFGLPQNRERIYFVCFRKDLNIIKFDFPSGISTPVSLQTFLEKDPKNIKIVEREDIIFYKDFEPETDLFGETILPNRPIQIGIVGKGGQGERIYHPLGHAITLSAYGGGVGSKTGLYQIDGKIRKLSPRECARIQGFPDTFQIISSQSQAYQQFGNSVAVNVLVAILNRIEQVLCNKTVKIMVETYRQELGSRTAKGGFANESNVVQKFANYKNDPQAIEWLKIMGYESERIKSLVALQIPTRLNRKLINQFGLNETIFDETQKYKKADVQVQLTITTEDGIIYRENISLKKAEANFNQIDKRSVATYQKMWNFDNQIAELLKKFTGETKPTANEAISLRDPRRWYLDELPQEQISNLLNFFNDNKLLILSDILKGRGMLSAEWFLVTKQNSNGSYDWILKNINEVLNFYAQGDIRISDRGGLILGRLTVQRKGGTPDPTSLQFKMKPLDLFALK